MNKVRKSFFILLFLLCFSFFDNVYASECTDSDISTLKALAEKIEFSKKFIEGEDERGNAFSLVGHNLNKNLLLEFTNGLRYVPSKAEEEIMTMLDGNQISIVVYGSKNHVCEETYITTLNIKLPVYNKYYKREECNGKESIDICKEWYDANDITEEQFKKMVLEAKETNPPIEKTNWFINFFIKNWIYIVSVIVGAGVGYGTVIIIRRKKRVKIDI